jgi:hypothetical protein
MVRSLTTSAYISVPRAWFDAAELHALAQYYEIALAEVDFEAKVLSEAIDRATRDEERAKQRRFRG